MTECEVIEGQRPARPQPIFCTFTESQEFLGVSHQTIYKPINEGFPSHKIGKKPVFLKSDLVKWIKNHWQHLLTGKRRKPRRKFRVFPKRWVINYVMIEMFNIE